MPRLNQHARLMPPGLLSMMPGCHSDEPEGRSCDVPVYLKVCLRDKTVALTLSLFTL